MEKQRKSKKVVKEINLQESFQAVRERREPVIFEDMYPHAIRHTFCSRCFESDMQPKVVQVLWGVSTIVQSLIFIPKLKISLDTRLNNLLFAPDIKKWEEIKYMEYGHYIHQQLEMFNFIENE